jgi:hypothetical protein
MMQKGGFQPKKSIAPQVASASMIELNKERLKVLKKLSKDLHDQK